MWLLWIELNVRLELPISGVVNGLDPWLDRRHDMFPDIVSFYKFFAMVGRNLHGGLTTRAPHVVGEI